MGRAISSGILVTHDVQIRDFATDKHKTVDDSSCGGGPGQLMKVDVVAPAIRAAKELNIENTRVILLDPAGQLFTQADSRRLASHEHLIFVCGRYEGIDARIEHYVDESLSIGNYVLTGGELAALVILDATIRHLPGVLGNTESAATESHEDNLLEHRQYTRPIEYEGHRVPEVLIGGNHEAIRSFRQADRVQRTRAMRPDIC